MGSFPWIRRMFVTTLVVAVCLVLGAHAYSDVATVGDVASAGSLSSDPSTPTTTTPAPPVTTTPAPPVTTTPAPPVTTTPAPPVTTTPAPPVTTTPPPPTTTPPVTTPAPPTTTAPAEAGVPPDNWTPAPTTPAPTTATPTTTTPAPTTTAPSTPTPTQTKAGITTSDNGRAGDTLTPASSSGGGKYAVIIAVAVVVAVVLLASIYVVRRNRSKKEETAAELRRQLDQLDMELGESAYAMAKASDDVIAGHSGNGYSGNGQGQGHSGSGSRSSFPFQKREGASPGSWSSSRATAVSSGDRDSLSGAWRDPEILAARIPYEKLRFGNLLSRGGFGEVFEGVYHNQRVAIKRLLPENRRRMAALEDFLKEAQLLAMLEHERITAFIGVAWDSPRDLCIVLEFMPNGDLRNLLSEWREQGRKTGWGDVRKVRIALHVAEALTYLHTLSPKVVHRDLKSKNVLLDDRWQAKLSDFGVSRAESTHNTMTTNVGSSLWIAPEVMMGNNYDEKADIFSFGVVLTELDSLQLPYYNAMTPDGRKMPDAAVLHLVTMGKLQAEFGSMSRTDIVLLGRSCLALDPMQRPSAADLRFRLSQILGSY